MSRDISLLHPKLRAIIPQIVQKCAERGLPVLVTDGFRSKAEQDAIYAKGRTAPGQIVTQVRWPNSAHNWGVAFDFCRNVRGREYDDGDNFFRRVAEIAKQYGLEWGGDWTRFVDKPHLQLKEFMPGNSTSWLRQAYGTPEKFKQSWAAAKPPEQEDEEEMARIVTIKDAPEYAKVTLYKLMERGIILGDGNTNLNKRLLDITPDTARLLVWLDRAGVFDKEE